MDVQFRKIQEANALTKNACKSSLLLLSYVKMSVKILLYGQCGSEPPKYKTNLIQIGYLSSPKLLPLRLIKMNAKKILKKEKVENFPPTLSNKPEISLLPPPHCEIYTGVVAMMKLKEIPPWTRSPQLGHSLIIHRFSFIFSFHQKKFRC